MVVVVVEVVVVVMQNIYHQFNFCTKVQSICAKGFQTHAEMQVYTVRANSAPIPELAVCNQCAGSECRSLDITNGPSPFCDPTETMHSVGI